LKVALTVPKGVNAAALADWAELQVLVSERQPVTATRLNRLLRGEGDDLAEEELAREALPDEEGDAVEADVELQLTDEGRGEREFRLEQLLDDIDLRLRLGPKIYPFIYEDDRVAWRGAPGENTYCLLLVLSSKEASYRPELRTHKVEAAFDVIALEALRRYLGREASALRFAKNAHDPEDNMTRPEKFRDAIDWLRAQLKLGAGRRKPPDEEREPHWEDEVDEHGRQPLNSYSDAGVDVVGWWRFADGRVGSPVLLAQCTVQLDWGEKVKDIDIKLWEKWIDFDTVPPQTALVIPFAVSMDSKQWDDRTVTAGVIIDRLRLLELLNELSDDELRTLTDEPTQAWVGEEVASLA
jgi:hypothetical protein